MFRQQAINECIKKKKELRGFKNKQIPQILKLKGEKWKKSQ
jgi:hypothetical protein